MTDMEKHVEEMVRKAAQAEKAADAMQFSQAACNSANALAVLENLRRSAK
jgi:hypothetical protein